MISPTRAENIPGDRDSDKLVTHDPPRILILGAASNYVASAIGFAEECGYEVAAAVDNLGVPIRPDRPDIPIHLMRQLPDSFRRLPAVCCVGTPEYRRRIVAEAAEIGIEEYLSLLHPRAYVSSRAHVGRGCIVSPTAFIGTHCSIGDHVLVRGLALISHHCVIANYVSVGPGVIVGGFVEIDSGVYIGLGARLIPNLHIGANSVIAAGAVVIRDVPANSLVAGTPAVVKRKGISGYRG